MFREQLAPFVADGSRLTLHKTIPADYLTFDIVAGKSWMAVRPMSLDIGDTQTCWPGTKGDPIAVVDTGGGCVFLSDPDDRLVAKTWPDQVDNPTWTKHSTSCQSIGHALTIEIGDQQGKYRYKIDTSVLPASVQGRTLVLCEMNEFMRGERGMNIGGITALTNLILVDYTNAKVGLKPK